jgi:hypothetical protein
MVQPPSTPWKIISTPIMDLTKRISSDLMSNGLHVCENFLDEESSSQLRGELHELTRKESNNSKGIQLDGSSKEYPNLSSLNQLFKTFFLDHLEKKLHAYEHEKDAGKTWKYFHPTSARLNANTFMTLYNGMHFFNQSLQFFQRMCPKVKRIQ